MPQKQKSELAIDDILPSESDGLTMYTRAVNYVMRFMTSHFKALSHFVTQVPHQKSPHTVSQSTVAPMKILHKDEKYTEANVDILESIRCDAELVGNPQVCNTNYTVNTYIINCMCCVHKVRPTYVQKYSWGKIVETA